MPADSDRLYLDGNYTDLHDDELEFFTDLAVNESQRWIEVSFVLLREAKFCERTLPPSQICC